jgi:hypothetical protein
MKFQVTEYIASLIINKCYQLLPLLRQIDQQEYLFLSLLFPFLEDFAVFNTSGEAFSLCGKPICALSLETLSEDLRKGLGRKAL